MAEESKIMPRPQTHSGTESRIRSRQVVRVSSGGKAPLAYFESLTDGLRFALSSQLRSFHSQMLDRRVPDVERHYLTTIPFHT